MWINGLGRTRPKDKYGRGETIRFKQDFARLKKAEVEEAGGDVEKVLLRLAQVDNADDFNVLFNILADTDAEYVDLDDFLAEMRTLRRDWGGQKVFYEKPTGAKKAPVLPDVKWQEGRIVRLYSAREAEHIRNLYVWAQQNGIATEGFDQYAHLAGTKDVAAPLHGHFADRAHTVKYARQKKAKGGGLICIVLTESASNLLRKTKDDPSKVATTGGEGNVTGGFGFKLENTFVSVAIGQATETWNFLKDKIDRIIFQDDGSATGAPSQATEGGTEGATELSSEGQEDEASAQGEPDVVRFDTWAEASLRYLEAGTLIRIMGNNPDISERLFAVKKTYNPKDLEYPDLTPDYLTWLQ